MNSVDVDQSGAISGDYAMNTDDFEYKVAEINLDKLKDQGSLVFSYKDNADADVASHDYKIVISNENREIDTFLQDASLNQDISNLLKNQTIFVRDALAQAVAPDETQLSNNASLFAKGKFRFAYDAAKKSLSLIVKPGDDNLAGSTAKTLEIGLDSSSNKEAIKMQTTK